MNDYTVGSNIGKIADGIKAIAEAWHAQNKIEQTKLTIELNRQKREWRKDGGSSETFNV